MCWEDCPVSRKGRGAKCALAPAPVTNDEDVMFAGNVVARRRHSPAIPICCMQTRLGCHDFLLAE
eukprot:CAMPEP_0172672042 /NCGR_PEP_ID=MMETSP1074-20121228/11305_1 /TAXON_ID=2916 /ORGANISM="Ceratium fusus, Strain PA161109" /LENGTH=64 /DNA_ID=CAMNT_0013489179 /DNA_START=68 /DNA_END=259 /DNA_ORIENTATION=-